MVVAIIYPNDILIMNSMLLNIQADGEEGTVCDTCPGDPTVKPKFGKCKEGFSCYRDDFSCRPGVCRKD